VTRAAPAGDEPVGLLRAADIKGASEGADTDLESLAVKDFPHCDAATPIFDIFAKCAAGLPIAVLDADGRFAGVVRPLDVFRELAVDEGERMTARDLDDQDASGQEPEAETSERSGGGDAGREAAAQHAEGSR